MSKLDGWFVGQSSCIDAWNCPGFDPSNPKHEWLELLGFKHVVQEEAFGESFECHHICISPVVCFDDAQVRDMKTQKELADVGYASLQEKLLAVLRQLGEARVKLFATTHTTVHVVIDVLRKGLSGPTVLYAFGGGRGELDMRLGDSDQSRVALLPCKAYIIRSREDTRVFAKRPTLLSRCFEEQDLDFPLGPLRLDMSYFASFCSAALRSQLFGFEQPNFNDLAILDLLPHRVLHLAKLHKFERFSYAGMLQAFLNKSSTKLFWLFPVGQTDLHEDLVAKLTRATHMVDEASSKHFATSLLDYDTCTSRKFLCENIKTHTVRRFAKALCSNTEFVEAHWSFDSECAYTVGVWRLFSEAVVDEHDDQGLQDLFMQVYTKFFCRSVHSSARLNDIAKVASGSFKLLLD